MTVCHEREARERESQGNGNREFTIFLRRRVHVLRVPSHPVYYYAVLNSPLQGVAQ